MKSIRTILLALAASLLAVSGSGNQIGFVTWGASQREVIFYDGNGYPRVDGMGQISVYQVHYASPYTAVNIKSEYGVIFVTLCDANVAPYYPQGYLSYCLSGDAFFMWGATHFASVTYGVVQSAAYGIFTGEDWHFLGNQSFQCTPGFDEDFYLP